MHITRTHRFLEKLGDNLQRLAIMCRIRNTDKLLKDCDERIEWHRTEMKRLKELRREVRRKAKTHREEFEMSFSVSHEEDNKDNKDNKEKQENEGRNKDKNNNTEKNKERKRKKKSREEKSDLYLNEYT